MKASAVTTGRLGTTSNMDPHALQTQWARGGGGAEGVSFMEHLPL